MVDKTLLYGLWTVPLTHVHLRIHYHTSGRKEGGGSVTGLLSCDKCQLRTRLSTLSSKPAPLVPTALYHCTTLYYIIVPTVLYPLYPSYRTHCTHRTVPLYPPYRTHCTHRLYPPRLLCFLQKLLCFFLGSCIRMKKKHSKFWRKHNNLGGYSLWVQWVRYGGYSGYSGTVQWVRYDGYSGYSRWVQW